MVDCELAWAAGLFEGEGNVYLNGYGRITLCLTTTDEDVIRRFAVAVQCGNIAGPYRYGKESNKPVFKWNCSARESVDQIWVDFEPWLGERRRAAFVAAFAERVTGPGATRPYRLSASDAPCSRCNPNVASQGGYRWHKRRGEPPCAAALAAYRLYEKLRWPL